MRKILFILFTGLSAFSVIAQKHAQARADSLLAELPKANDSEKLVLYIQLMDTYNLFDREAAFRFAEPALDLAKKNGDKKVALGRVKNSIGRIYWRARDFGTAMKYHQEAREILERAKSDQWIVVSVRFLGQDYADGGQYPEALKYFNDAFVMYRKLGDKGNMAQMQELFSWVYEKQGDYLKASQAAYAALSFYEELGAKNDAAIAAASVASYYMQLGNYKEALKLFEKSESVYKIKGDQINLAFNYILIGKVCRLTGMHNESKKNYDSALTIGAKFSDLTIVASAFEGLADNCLAQGDFLQALAHYLSAGDRFRKVASKRDLARVYCSIGECYRLEKSFDLARSCYDSALFLAQEVVSKPLLANYYRGVEKLDSTMGHWEGAYLNHKNFIFLRDSVFNQNNVSEMVQLQLQHDFDRKELAAQQVQHEKDLRQQRQMIFLGIIAVLVLILAIVLYRNQKRVAGINKELELKSVSLEEENREKTGILKIVSHDLRSPFNKIKGLINLLQIDKDMSEKDRDQYFAFIEASINQGTYLIQHLLDAQRIDHASDIPSYETFDVEKFIHDFELMTGKQLQVKEQKLKIVIETNNKLILTDPQILTRILDNLVSNASKFSEKGKLIYLRVWQEDNKLNFSIRDEGPGISEDDQKKLFRKFQKLSAQPTAGENSTGLGLSITKALVEKLNGSILVNSSLGKGAEMVVSLPVTW